MRIDADVVLTTLPPLHRCTKLTIPRSLSDGEGERRR